MRPAFPAHSFPFFFPIFFVALWVFVCVVLSTLGGWRTLARAYPVLTPPSGMTFRFQSGALRSKPLGTTNYNGCLCFVSGPAGLLLSVFFPFRVAHAPLFVPWTDVSVEVQRGWLRSSAELRFARTPDVRLRLSRPLAERLLAAGGNVVPLTGAV